MNVKTQFDLNAKKLSQKRNKKNETYKNDANF